MGNGGGIRGNYAVIRSDDLEKMILFLFNNSKNLYLIGWSIISDCITTVTF
jgi:hypothetical protein